LYAVPEPRLQVIEDMVAVADSGPTCTTMAPLVPDSAQLELATPMPVVGARLFVETYATAI
jgi:hypothetical protein